jgi:general secretion pathway protein G
MLLTTIRNARQKAARRAAFTLLEVLIVVAILVILASAASIALFRYLDDAKISRAESDMQAIETALKTYYLKNDQQWPQEGEDGLVAIIPYLENGEAGLVTPWGGRYGWKLWQSDQDGTYRERPLVYCQTPNQNKPEVTWPRR